MADLQQFLDLLNFAGQHHQHGRGAVGRQSVTLIRLEFFLAVQDFQVGDLLEQCLYKCVFVGGRKSSVNAFVVENIHIGTDNPFLLL
ncbi:hypothetical protein D3C86_2030810 [compost metagenome]